MNANHIKQSPMLSLPSLGGGSHSTLVRKASGGAHDPGTPGTVNQTNNAAISFGNPFTDNSGNYVTYAEFQNNGTEVLVQNLWGERKYNLSSAYDVSSSSVSYKSGSINYWTIGQYNNDALGSYRHYSGRVMRFSGGTTGYFYGGDGTTKVIGNLNQYTSSSPTVTSSSSSPFSTSPTTYGNGCSVYVKKSGGGIAFLQANHNRDVIYLRNYANNTTSTVSSSSTLDISGISIQGIFAAFLSVNGTTMSIWVRDTSSQYIAYKWTLSTAFDLSTAGSMTTTNTGIKNGFFIESGIVVNDHAVSGRLLAWTMYGELTAFTYTVDGDANNTTRSSNLSRRDNGAYHNGSSYGIWYNDGKQVIDQGYSSSHYVYDSTSNPYGWRFHNKNFGNVSSGYTYIGTEGTNEGLTFSDGRFNANRSKHYTNWYCCGSSSHKVTEANLSTPGDITTLSSGYNNSNSSATFTGWTGGYTSHVGWYDKLNNKYHAVDIGSAQQYYVFDLNSSGEFTGTYTTSPTGFTPGDFNGKAALQPLSHNGKYFVYFSGQTCYIIFLDYAFEPARGITQIHSFNVQYNLPNGSTRNSDFNRMYVSSGRIFFAKYYNTDITTVVDITIDGTVPDDIT